MKVAQWNYRTQKLVEVHVNVEEASKKTGVAIKDIEKSAVSGTKGVLRTAGGYVWTYNATINPFESISEKSLLTPEQERKIKIDEALYMDGIASKSRSS